MFENPVGVGRALPPIFCKAGGRETSIIADLVKSQLLCEEHYRRFFEKPDAVRRAPSPMFEKSVWNEQSTTADFLKSRLE